MPWYACFNCRYNKIFDDDNKEVSQVMNEHYNYETPQPQHTQLDPQAA